MRVPRRKATKPTSTTSTTKKRTARQSKSRVNARTNADSAIVATRQRLLDVAGEVFAEQGFRLATVRDICTRAGANLASVNYHFGDKAGLYEAVMRYSLELGDLQYPLVAEPTMNLRERLHSLVQRLLSRMLDDGRPAWHGKLMTREMVEPSSALDNMIIQAIEPTYRVLSAIVSEMLGEDAPPGCSRPCELSERTRWACNSIIGQCLMYKHCQPVIIKLQLAHEDLLSQGSLPHHSADKHLAIERLATHIVTFSLGGLDSMRAAEVSTI